MAGSAVIGTLRAILSLDTAEFDTASARVSQSAKAWSRDFKTIGQQATQLGSSLTKTLTVPIAALGVGAAKLAIDFESSFAGISKTVDDVVDKGGNLTAFGKELQQSFRDLAKQIPININDLNRLGEAAGALGIPKASILEFTKIMAQLGVTTNLTADQAADSIARIQNIYGAAGKDTDRFASTLVALGNAGASTESEIVEMSQRIAGAGHQIGITQAQTLAFASTLASIGINAEAGGSAISRIFLKMKDAVMEGGGALDEFARVAGVSSQAFKAAFEKDAAQATVMFIQGLNRLKNEGENVNQTMEGMVGKNIILKQTLNGLTGAGDLLSKQLDIANVAWRENSALTEEAQKRFATTESQLKLLWNRIQDVGITIGNALLPTIQTLVGFVGDLIPVIDRAAKIFASLPQPIQVTAIGIAALVAALGPAIYIFGQLALASASVTAAFTANGLASRFLLADLGFLLTGLRTMTVAVMTNVTAYGAMGAASIALTSAVRALWAAMAAHPLVALAAGIGAVTLALTKLYTASVDRKQEQLISGIKAETIARAEQAGVILKSADAHAKYLEAVDALQKIETVRQSKFGGTIEQLRQAIVYELELGRITQEQANVRLAALAGEQQAADVRSKHISITEIAKQAEAAFAAEIKATGYTVAELQKLLKDDPQTFAAFAKQVGLSSDTVARLKEETKQTARHTKEFAKEQKDAEKDAAELTRELERQKAAMHALGITTKHDVNEEMGKLLEGFSLALAAGVPLKTAMGALVLKLQDLAKRAKESNAEVDELTSGLRQLQTQMLLLDPIPAKLMGKTDFSVITKGLQSVNLETAHASFLSRELWDAYDALGIKTTASLKKQAEEARTAYGLIAASGTATRDQLLEARQAVLDAEIAAGERTVGIWEGTIKPAVLGVMEGIVDSVSAGLVDMIGHWNRAGDIFKDIWQGIKNSFLNVLDDMLSKFLNNFIKGMLDGINSSGIGQALGRQFASLFGFGGGGGGGGGLLGGLFGGGGGGMLGGLFGGGVASGVPSITAYGAGAGYGGGAASIGSVTGGTIAAQALSGVVFMEALAPGFFKQAFTDFWAHSETNPTQGLLEGMAYTGISDPYEYARQYGISEDVISALISQGGIPGYSMGTMGQYVDFGAGTLAMLHGREKITPEGASIDSAAWGGGSMTVQLVQDGRKTAQWLVPYIPEEVFRLELA